MQLARPARLLAVGLVMIGLFLALAILAATLRSGALPGYRRVLILCWGIVTALCGGLLWRRLQAVQ